MTISVGDKIPSGTLKRLDEQGINDVHIEDYLKNKIDTKTNQKTFNSYFNSSSFSCICWASILNVAMGLASSLFKPIGLPVTSQ